MWDDRKSLILSKFCVWLFMCLILVTVVAAPRLTYWFLGFSRADLAETEGFFLATIYAGAVPAAYLLYSLLRLLLSIERKQVFITENVERLRRISWSCFAGALVSLLSALYYLPWIFVAVAAAFMGLVVRVVKNVVAQAVALQDEADYTV